MLSASCAPLGLYTKKHLNQEASKARSRGFQDGKAAEVLRAQRERQARLETSQPEPEYYEMTIPAHTSSDGIQVAQHPATFNFSQK